MFEEIANNIVEIISIASVLLAFLSTIITLIIKYVKKAKQYIEEKNWTALFNEIKPLVGAAEEIVNFKGGDKKEWVLTKLNQFAINNKLTFEIDKVSQAIEEIVDLTKKVNKRDKDKIIEPPKTEPIVPTTPTAPQV